MNYDRFLQNIIDQIKEAQIKLGYAYETTRLYYPETSIKNLLFGEQHKEERTEADVSNLVDFLRKDSFFENTSIGKIIFSGSNERIEVCVSPDGAKYVHEHVETPVFLEALIQLFQSNHHCKIEEIERLFSKFSDSYKIEKMGGGADFDYVFYFEDKKIDAYYYCIKMEMGHTIYHRFTKEDYNLLKNFDL